MSLYPADADRAAYPVVLYWEPSESSSSSEAGSDSDEGYVEDICLERGTVRTWRTGAWMKDGNGKKCAGCEGPGKKEDKTKGGGGGMLKIIGLGGEGDKKKEEGKKEKGKNKKEEKEIGCECSGCCCGKRERKCQQEARRASSRERYGKGPGSELYSYGGFLEEHHVHQPEDRDRYRYGDGAKRTRKVRFADEVDSSEDDVKGRVFYWDGNDRSSRRRDSYDRGDEIEVVPARGHVTRWEAPMASGAKGYLGDTRWIEGIGDYSQDERMGI